MYMREVRNLHALKCMNLCNLNSYLLRALTILHRTGGNQECIFMQTNGLFYSTVCIFISAFDNDVAYANVDRRYSFHSYFRYFTGLTFAYLTATIRLLPTRHKTTLIKFACELWLHFSMMLWRQERVQSKQSQFAKIVNARNIEIFTEIEDSGSHILQTKLPTYDYRSDLEAR